MPNANYLAGRRVEYEVIKMFKAKGYEAARTAGSHSSADVIAWRRDAPVALIQCKRTTLASRAKVMLDKWRKETVTSAYYHQTLAVKVKGSKGLLTATV